MPKTTFQHVSCIDHRRTGGGWKSGEWDVEDGIETHGCFPGL